jgi:hypothetical protein
LAAYRYDDDGDDDDVDDDNNNNSDDDDDDQLIRIVLTVISNIISIIILIIKLPIYQLRGQSLVLSLHQHQILCGTTHINSRMTYLQ